MQGLAVLLQFGIALMLLQGSGVAPPVDQPKIDWLRKPPGTGVYACLATMQRGAQEGIVNMRCETAPNDKIRNCVIVSNSNAPDTRYEKAAICASKYFNIRATGPDGKPIFGAAVNVPFRFAAPATYETLVRNADKPLRSTAAGADPP